MTHPLLRITRLFDQQVRTLPNGLRIGVDAGGRSPVVAIHAWVLAGLAREVDKAEGLAHLVEHLLVDAAHHRYEGGVLRHVEKLGGEINLWVALKCIVLFLVLPRENLDEGLKLVADLVFRPEFTEAMVRHELEVLRRELAEGNVRPMRPYEAVRTRLLQTLGHRPIPAKSVLAADIEIGREAIAAYHRELFVPSNAVIAVAGDVEVDDVERRCERYFGDLPHTKVPPLHSTASRCPPLVVAAGEPGAPCGVSVAYQLPQLPPELEASLTVVSLASTNPEDRTGMRDALLGEGLALMGKPYIYFERMPAVFSYNYEAPPEAVAPIVRQTIAEIERLRRVPLPTRAVDRVRWELAYENARENDNVQNRARRIGCFELLKEGIAAFPLIAKALIEVTPESVRADAEAALLPERRVIVVLAPPDRVDQLRAELTPIVGRPPAGSVPAVGRATPAAGPRVLSLSGGGVVVADRRESSDLAVMHIGFRNAGSASERRGARGAAAAVGVALGYTGEVPPPGGRISSFCDHESVGLEVECVGDLLPEWLDYLAPRLSEPPPELAEYAVEVARGRSNAVGQDPEALAMQLALGAQMGKHPYGRHPEGNVGDLEHLTPAAVVRHFTERVALDGLFVVATGGVDPEALADGIEKLQGRLEVRPRAVVFDAPGAPPLAGPKAASADFDCHEHYHVVSWRGIPSGSSDRAALLLLDCALAWYGGRLFRDLRDEQHLLYHLITTETFGPKAGTYGLTFATDPPASGKALAEFRRLVAQLLREGLGDDELERCRSACLGSEATASYSSSMRAEALAHEVKTGVRPGQYAELGERLRRATKADVDGLARRILRNQRLAYAVVGPGARGAQRQLLAGLLHGAPKQAARRKRA